MAKLSRGWAHQRAVVHAAGDPRQRGEEDGQDADRNPTLQAWEAMTPHSPKVQSTAALRKTQAYRWVAFGQGRNFTGIDETNAAIVSGGSLVGLHE